MTFLGDLPPLKSVFLPKNGKIYRIQKKRWFFHRKKYFGVNYQKTGFPYWTVLLMPPNNGVIHTEKISHLNKWRLLLSLSTLVTLKCNSSFRFRPTSKYSSSWVSDCDCTKISSFSEIKISIKKWISMLKILVRKSIP